MQPLSRISWRGIAGAFGGAVWLHLAIILAAGAALRWPLLALAPFFTVDSYCCYYHYAANQFLAGLPFDSGLHYPPGYSLFLAAILAVTDGSTAAAMLVQHLLGLLTGVLVYCLGRRLFGPLVGLLAALLTVLDVELALYEHAVMTETLFALLLLCALAVVLLRVPGSIWLKVAGFGLVAGAATLVRPTGILLPGLVLFLPGLGAASGAGGAAAKRTRVRRLWQASRRVRLTLVAFVGSGAHRGTGDGLESADAWDVCPHPPRCSATCCIGLKKPRVACCGGVGAETRCSDRSRPPSAIIPPPHGEVRMNAYARASISRSRSWTGCLGASRWTLCSLIHGPTSAIPCAVFHRC